jgi:hypothetical protein
MKTKTAYVARAGVLTKVGAGFTNPDGSIAIKLTTLPVNGIIIIKDDQPAEQEPARPIEDYLG